MRERGRKTHTYIHADSQTVIQLLQNVYRYIIVCPYYKQKGQACQNGRLSAEMITEVNKHNLFMKEEVEISYRYAAVNAENEP